MPAVHAYRRRLIILLAALATALLSSLAPAAASAAKTAPGDNGDVKIHAVGTSSVDDRNQPHVCQFYLDAFNFDTIQHVSWTIEQQPPTGRDVVRSGTLTLVNGRGTSAVMSLPAGHYKLVWTFAGEHGRAKFKVFWSDCAATSSPSPSTSMMASGGATPSSPSSSGKSVSPNSSGKAVTPTGSAVGPSLAETGVTLTPWLASGLALLLGGSWLTRRTRGRRMR